MAEPTPDLAQLVPQIKAALAAHVKTTAGTRSVLAELDAALHESGALPEPTPTPAPSGPGILTRIAAGVGGLVKRIPYQAIAIAVILVVSLAQNGGHGLSCSGLPSIIPTPVKPTVTTGPIRVIEVTDQAKALSQTQLEALNSTTVRAYLDSHCAKDSDGRPAWRSWSPDVDPSGESKSWQDAWATAKPLASSPPCVVIFPAGGLPPVAAPLPADATGLLALLTKYGGK